MTLNHTTASTTPSLSHLILAFYIPALCYAIGLSVLSPILPLYADNFDVSFSLVGLVLAADSIGTLLADVPAGILLQRYSVRWVMLLGLVTMIISGLFTFLIPSIVALFFLRLLGGFGRALYGTSQHKYIATVTQAHQRGRFIAGLGGLYRGGQFIGPAIGGSIAFYTNLRVPFLVYAFLIAIGALFVLRYQDNTRPQGSQRKMNYSALLDVVKHHYRVLGFAGLGQLFGQATRAGRVIIIPLYAARVLQMNEQDVGFLISLSSFVDMLMFYVAGWLMDNHGRKSAIVPSFFLQALGLFIIPFIPTVAAMYALSLFNGFANGLSTGTFMTVGADLSPLGLRGEFLGIWRLIGDTGTAFGPLFIGFVTTGVSFLPAVIVVGCFGLAASAIFGLAVPETSKTNLAASSAAD
ncbi:MFS transporter [Anaerolineales bacterium]